MTNTKSNLVNSLLVVCLVACSAPESKPRQIAAMPAPVQQEARAATLVAPPPAIVEPGRFRVLHGPTSCRMSGGVLPMVYVQQKAPRAGEQLRILWVSRACEPRPDEPAILFFSLRPATPVDLTSFGHTDCWLLVNLDHALVPANGTAFFKPAPGEYELHWDVPSDFKGITFYAQMAFVTNETKSGWTLSPGLEILF